jgi:hypothetical protein
VQLRSSDGKQLIWLVLASWYSTHLAPLSPGSLSFRYSFLTSCTDFVGTFCCVRIKVIDDPSRPRQQPCAKRTRPSGHHSSSQSWRPTRVQDRSHPLVRDNHYVQKQLILIEFAPVETQCVECGHLERARLLDEHSGGVALAHAEFARAQAQDLERVEKRHPILGTTFTRNRQSLTAGSSSRSSMVSTLSIFFSSVRCCSFEH